uniref:Putative ovule protein n=1 Tax=Solanum chacoense TaxID=4108 RepID=A0A0V0IMD6_SOLCH
MIYSLIPTCWHSNYHSCCVSELFSFFLWKLISSKRTFDRALALKHGKLEPFVFASYHRTKNNYGRSYLCFSALLIVFTPFILLVQ